MKREAWLVCQRKHDDTNALEVEFTSTSKQEALKWVEAAKKIHGDGGIHYVINSTVIY